MLRHTSLSKYFVWSIAATMFFGVHNDVSAITSVTEIQNRIQQTNQAKADIEREIAKYQDQLDSVGKEKSTLETAIKILDVSRSKLSAEIALTQNKIQSTTLTIQRLNLNIKDKNDEIRSGSNALASAIREMRDIDSQPLIFQLISSKTLSETWSAIDDSIRFQGSVREHIIDVQSIKKDLEKVKVETESKKRELNKYQNQLADQKKILDSNKKEKALLLAQTQNKESEYRKIVADKEAERLRSERELATLEAELKIAIDPSTLPSTRSGVLAWPLDMHFITQYFGNTSFATANSQIYKGQGHNGIDLRAAVGTPVKAALSGVIEATGDTDIFKGCIAFGKWMLVRHNNGLSTLYAHLSLIRFSAGTQVVTGDVIAYSGATGQVTGPHLHFTVYATQGIRFVKYSSKSKCYGATVPIADNSAYLNPLSFL